MFVFCCLGCVFVGCCMVGCLLCGVYLFNWENLMVVVDMIKCVLVCEIGCLYLMIGGYGL